MAESGGSGPSKRELFEQHAMPHLDALYSAGLHLTRSPDDAKDLLQDTVLRAYRFFHQFTIGTNCRAWLLTILYNTFRNGYRRGLREQVSPTSQEYERELEAESRRVDPSLTNPESLLFGQLLDQQVEQALRDLREDFRAVVLMIDIEELSYQEAAKVLGIPIGTVRSRLSRGRAIMRLVLKKYARSQGYLRS